MDEIASDLEPADSGRDETGWATGPPGTGSSAGSGSSKEEKKARATAEEQSWIRRAQGGDEEAFGWLVRTYEVRAFRIARGLVPNEEDARDVVQEAFLRVFRSVERFDFGYAFSTWLHRIVTNLAIDYLRKRRVVGRGGVLDDEESQGPEPVDERVEDPSANILREETAGEVHDCLAALAPHFQSVLVLRELDGLSCAEIAEIVGATNVTVRWRLHRGRKLFQEEWERRDRVSSRGLGGLEDSANTPTERAVEDVTEGDTLGDET